MQLSHLTNGAVTAERNRQRMQRSGMTPKGDFLWTETELAVLRKLHGTMSYKQMAKRLKGRSWHSIRNKAQRLGMTKQRLTWTGAQIVLLRRVYQNGTIAEVRAAFPDLTSAHISKIAYNHGMRRPRRPFVATGIPAIDQIRKRAFELRYSMGDIDHLARSKKYFQYAGCHKYINHRAVARAILALDGVVAADWHSEI